MYLSMRTLVRPEMFIIALLAFLSVGVMSNRIMDDLGHGFSWLFALYVGLAMSLYYLGTRFQIELDRAYVLPVFVLVSLLMTIREFGLYSVPMITVLCIISFKWGLLKEHCAPLAALGLALMLVNLALVGSLPLLDSAQRFGSQTALMLFGYAFALVGTNYLFSKDPAKGLCLGAIVLVVVALYGFRSYLLLFAVSLGVQAVMMGLLDAKRLAALALTALAVVVAGGYVAIATLDQDWHLSPAALLFYRMGFTTHMLDLSCRASGLWGVFHGEIWTLPSTSPMVGSLIAGSGNITTTIIGPLALDGGILEMPLMAFAGASINTLYQRARADLADVPLYATFFSFLMVSVEISPVPIFFLSMLFALLLSNRKNNK